MFMFLFKKVDSIRANERLFAQSEQIPSGFGRESVD